jgi:hypothetical protein
VLVSFRTVGTKPESLEDTWILLVCDCDLITEEVTSHKSEMRKCRWKYVLWNSVWGNMAVMCHITANFTIGFVQSLQENVLLPNSYLFIPSTPVITQPSKTNGWLADQPIQPREVWGSHQRWLTLLAMLCSWHIGTNVFEASAASFIIEECSRTWILRLQFLSKQANIQNYWVFGLCPSSGILETRKHNVSETWSVSALRRGGGSLRKS